MTKWSPSALLARAIGRIEAQSNGKLDDWGSAEHISCCRYLVEEACQAAKIPLSAQQIAAIKTTYDQEYEFLGYASNAKKKLVEFGSLTPKKAKYA